MADAPEDRALARKLRNRESAAASRDRARLYTKTLEDQVAALSGQVGELQARVRELEAELAASHSRQRHEQRWVSAPAPTLPHGCGDGCAPSPDADAGEHGEECGRCGAPPQDPMPRGRSQHAHHAHAPTDHEFLSLRTALAALRPVGAGPGDRLRRPAPAFGAAADAAGVEGAVAGALAAIKCSPHLAGLAPSAAATPAAPAAAGAVTARAATQRLEGFSLGAPPFSAGGPAPGVGVGAGKGFSSSAPGRAIAPGLYTVPAALPGSAAASTATAAAGFIPGLAGLQQLQGRAAGASTASLGSCSTRSLRSDAGSTVHSSGGSSGRNSAAPSPHDDGSDVDHSAAASPAFSGASAPGAGFGSGQGLGHSYTGSKRKASSRQGSVLDLGDTAAAFAAPQTQRQQQPSGAVLGALASLSADAVFGSSGHRDAAGRNVRACRRSDAEGSAGDAQAACGVAAAADPSSFASSSLSLHMPASSSSAPSSFVDASNPLAAFATATATTARAGPTPAPDSLACFPAACAVSLARNADHESAALVLAQGFF